MSILTVTNLSHGYGDREILKNVSFRLLNGEHVGLIGANGEGKSSFMNIITGKLEPEEGQIQWARGKSSPWPIFIHDNLISISPIN